MRQVFGLLTVLFVAACRESDKSGRPGPASYVRPEIERLLSIATGPHGRGVDPDSVREAAYDIRGLTASQALWGAVKRAEEAGLVELYGVEEFSASDPSYRALFFVRTGGDRVHCLYADGDVHNSRSDLGSVPAHAVALDTVDGLRRRIEAELPLQEPVYLASDVDDGGLFLIHIYRDGESHHALWYQPTPELGQEHEAIVEFRRAIPVDNIIRALWAAAPPCLFPTREESYVEKYGATRGFAQALDGK